MCSAKAKTHSHHTNILVVMGGFPKLEIERRHSIDFGNFVVKVLRENGYDAKSYILNDKRDLNSLVADKESIIFNSLIGEFGEDGKFASFLELNGISYTGCGSQAASITMDKAKFKLLIHSLGIRTPSFQLIDFELWKRKRPKLETPYGEKLFYNPATTTPQMNLPVYIKANIGGFNMGGSVVLNKNEFENSLIKAGEACNTILIEELISGVDAHVPILNGTPLSTIESTSITPNKHEYPASPHNYNVREKYFLVPGRFPRNVMEKLEADSSTAYKELWLRGLCRADFRVTSTGEPFMLEINSQHSIRKNRMALKAAAAFGLQPISLIEQIIGNRWIPKT